MCTYMVADLQFLPTEANLLLSRLPMLLIVFVFVLFLMISLHYPGDGLFWTSLGQVNVFMKIRTNDDQICVIVYTLIPIVEKVKHSCQNLNKIENIVFYVRQTWTNLHNVIHIWTICWTIFQILFSDFFVGPFFGQCFGQVSDNCSDKLSDKI